MSLTEKTLTEVRDLLRNGDTTSVALTQAILDRIEAVDGKVQAYVRTTAELALKQAQAADVRLAAGETTPLLGVPIGIKDLICSKGVETTAGSKILEGFKPPYNAFVTDQLKEAGAVIVGMTNTDEFGMGSSTEFSAYQNTYNPWDLTRVPGGSSGGSAAAVSGGMAYGSLGTDTGGSVRMPASLCSLVGVRPTYGRVSRWGVIAYASSLDQVGTFGKTVKDAATMLGVVAGHDPRDSTSLMRPVPDYEAALTGDIKGLKVGVPKQYFIDGMNPEIETSVRQALDVMANLGAEIHEIDLHMTDYALAAYYLIATSEASANLARYDGIRYGPRVAGKDVTDTTMKTRALFGPEVKSRIMLGTFALSSGYYDAYYGKALKARTLIIRDFEKAFEKVDVIATPTSPDTAFKPGERTLDPLEMYLSDIYTVSLNLSAGCGLSVPCGFDSQNLPIGLQLMGNTLQEATILNAAHAYEQATDWHKMRPTL
ncbi:MAG: aspartyl-tRNA(Asn)/glutamyl-tRNA(Gln) amidotransferase subunit A [Cellvibrionaceae bacterium]|jgi:aspartyl-tRNA(Asn)/glutamyl-tRNA(Gln) amidotransferase subunit A